MNGKEVLVNRIKGRISVYNIRGTWEHEGILAVIDGVVYKLTDEGRELEGMGIAKDFDFNLAGARIRNLNVLTYKTLIGLGELI